MMLHDVVWFWAQFDFHQTFDATFLLFLCVKNKDTLVWLSTPTLLNSPRCSQIPNLHNSNMHRTTCCIRLVTRSNIIQWSWIPQCWMMLHSFGQDLMQSLVIKKAINLIQDWRKFCGRLYDNVAEKHLLFLQLISLYTTRFSAVKSELDFSTKINETKTD